MTRPIRLYRFQRNHGRLNFGDDMSASLLEAASGRPVDCVSPARAEVIGLGSILHRFTRRQAYWRQTALNLMGLGPGRPVVWGAGFAKVPSPVIASGLDARVVRGPVTAKLLGARAATFGDPGLLVAQVFPAKAKAQAWGVVPHYTDKSSPELARLMESLPGAYLIDVEAPFAEVLAAISASDAILTSSLHGLISADAYGIPAARVHFDDTARIGDLKFEDYAGSVGRSTGTAVAAADGAKAISEPPPRSVIDKLCANLLAEAANLP